jgi:hypothetical protein
MKIIILILANDSGIYLECQKFWRTYMNLHPNIKSYFIKFDPQLTRDILVDNNTIFIKGNDSFVPGCLIKTLESINYVLKNEDFDFIFRTNMSSVVNLNSLYDFVINNKNDYSGVIGRHNNINFASGAGILLSKQLCSNLISYKNLLNYNLLDDVSIGLLFQNNNVSIFPLTRFEAYNYENNVNQITKEMIQNFYHFRCKSDTDNNKTLLLMKKIIKLIY